MDPTGDTLFGEIGEGWALRILCGCRITDFISAYRDRHFAPDMTAARLCTRLKCQSCGGRVIEAAWEPAHVGPGGLRQEARRIMIVEAPKGPK